MKIDIYTLLGLVKDSKAPKKIKYDDKIWAYNSGSQDYCDLNETNDLFGHLFNCFTTNAFINNKVEIIEEKPTVEKSEDRIEKALEFLETQYNTYPNGEMWRGALKNILQGKSADDVYEPFIEDNKKLEKIDFKTLNTQKEKNRAMKDAINELIDTVNKLKEGKE